MCYLLFKGNFKESPFPNIFSIVNEPLPGVIQILLDIGTMTRSLGSGCDEVQKMQLTLHTYLGINSQTGICSQLTPQPIVDSNCVGVGSTLYLLTEGCRASMKTGPGSSRGDAGRGCAWSGYFTWMLTDHNIDMQIDHTQSLAAPPSSAYPFPDTYSMDPTSESLTYTYSITYTTHPSTCWTVGLYLV